MKLKKWILLSGMTVMMMLAGCGSSEESDASSGSEAEYLEGYDNLTEEETTQKLIMEADQIEVVPDDKE